MKVIIRAKAADDLVAIFAWIGKDDLVAAEAVIRRIRKHISILEIPECAYIGRPGRSEGTRELVEGRYIMVYVIDEKRQRISILSIVHCAQRK